jgi:uncharacterized protein
MYHILELKIFPSSGKQELKAEPSGMLKCFLTSVPEKGKANQELIKFLAKKVGISQGQVVIICGATSRLKKIRFDVAMTRDELYKN